MHKTYEKDVSRLETATSVDITLKASSSKRNMRLKPKTVKARRPPPPPPPESPTNPSAHFNYDLNTSIASANISDVESDSEFPEITTKSSRSLDNLPNSNVTKNIVKRARSASENIPRRHSHSLVSRFKGYFAAGEKELTEEQKRKQQERQERRLGKAREAALTKVYKYTTYMEKRYKKMLQKLQETMENMKSCSAEWGREMQELKSWGVLPAVLKAREKVRVNHYPFFRPGQRFVLRCCAFPDLS